MLTSTNGGTGVTYSWTGPDGFTSSLQNPTIVSPSVANAGTYTLLVTDANTNCTSTDSVIVIVGGLVTACALDTFPTLASIPFVGATTNFQFNFTGLINTPFNISGVPTSLPAGYTGTVGLTITTIGDIGFTQANFFGEDGILSLIHI